MTKYDLLVLGAGPAGCAAAIQARRGGLSVIMLDVRDKPGVAPGETLHPGVEVIFEQLGVGPALRSAGFHRHRGIWIETLGERHFQAYGHDQDGPWRGLQVDRALLHELMQSAAVNAGAELLTGRAPSEVLRDGDRVAGVQFGKDYFEARWIVDGTGRRAWLANRLELLTETYSPPLRARFGWSQSQDCCTDGQPRIMFLSGGWNWYAPLGHDRLAWLELRSCSSNSSQSGMDMTWRLRPECAGAGYFLVGDSAAQLDPSSSHGVLRALMGGMYLGFLTAATARRQLSERAITTKYQAWIRGQFLHDVARLRDMHRTWLNMSNLGST